MSYEDCRSCGGVPLTGWSGSGAHFCRTCSSEVDRLDTFSFITGVMREQRDEIRRLRGRLQFDLGGSDKIDELEGAITYLRFEISQLKDKISSIEKDGE